MKYWRLSDPAKFWVVRVALGARRTINVAVGRRKFTWMYSQAQSFLSPVVPSFITFFRIGRYQYLTFQISYKRKIHSPLCEKYYIIRLMPELYECACDSDVGDDFGMTVTEFRCWWHLLDVGARRLCKQIVDVVDQNSQNRHQHLKVVINTFRFQHPSPTSM